MKEIQARARVCLDQSGRIAIPPEISRALGLEAGEGLAAVVEDGRLILEREAAIWDRIHALYAHIPRDVSLADELIAERREEARREDEVTAAWLQQLEERKGQK